MFLHIKEAVERMGDWEIYYQVSQFFAQNIFFSLETLQQAILSKKTDEIRRLTHSLKSNCATVGASELYEDLKNMEQAAKQSDLSAVNRYFALIQPRILELKEELLLLPEASPFFD